MPMEYLFLALKLVSWVIIADAILSWFVARDKFPRSLTSQMTEPLYRPIHKVLDPAKTGGFDLAPLVILVAIQLITSMLGKSMMPY